MHTRWRTQEHRPVLASSRWPCWPNSWRGARRWPWRAGPYSVQTSPPCDVEWSRHLTNKQKHKRNSGPISRRWLSHLYVGWVVIIGPILSEWRGRMSTYLWRTERQRWGHCWDHWGTLATVQKLGRQTRQRKRHQGQKQQSIKIAPHQSCKDGSTDDFHGTALCPDKDATLPAHHEPPRRLIRASSISGAGRN